MEKGGCSGQAFRRRPSLEIDGAQSRGEERRAPPLLLPQIRMKAAGREGQLGGGLRWSQVAEPAVLATGFTEHGVPASSHQ